MGINFSRLNLLKSPKKPKGPSGRRPPSAIRRSAEKKSKVGNIEVSKADLDSVTLEAETVLQNPNKNRAQRPQNRRPPGRAKQSRAATLQNEDALNVTINNAKENTKPEPPKSKKPLEMSIDEKSDDVSEVDAIHHRLSEKKFLVPPNNTRQRQASEGDVETIMEEETTFENNSKTLPSKKRQRKLSKVLELG